MKRTITLPAGNVLTANAGARAARATQTEDTSITASIAAYSSTTFGPYPLERHFSLVGDGTSYSVAESAPLGGFVDGVTLGQTLADLTNITWTVELLFTTGSRTIDGVGVAAWDDIFENTAAYSGSTDTWPEVVVDTTGINGPTWAVLKGGLLAKFNDPAGFLLVIESQFASGVSGIDCAPSGSFAGSTRLCAFGLDGSGVTLSMPSDAMASDPTINNPYQRIALLYSETECMVSINGCPPLSITREAIDFTAVGMVLKGNTKFLRMASPEGITAGHLMLLSMS